MKAEKDKNENGLSGTEAAASVRESASREELERTRQALPRDVRDLVHAGEDVLVGRAQERLAPHEDRVTLGHAVLNVHPTLAPAGGGTRGSCERASGRSRAKVLRRARGSHPEEWSNRCSPGAPRARGMIVSNPMSVWYGQCTSRATP